MDIGGRESWAWLCYESLLLSNHKGIVRIWQSKSQTAQVKPGFEQHEVLQPSSVFPVYHHLDVECTFTVELPGYVVLLCQCFDCAKDEFCVICCFIHSLPPPECIQHILCAQVLCNVWNEKLQSWTRKHLLVLTNINSHGKHKSIYPNKTHNLKCRLVIGFSVNRDLSEAPESQKETRSNFG